MDGKKAGGVYVVSLGGPITGFHAGHMAEGWQGAIIIDGPLKPEDACSKTKRTAANRKLLSTVKSRKANPDTPIIVIMQRLAREDVNGLSQEQAFQHMKQEGLYGLIPDAGGQSAKSYAAAT